MEVTILKGQATCQDSDGKIYEINGLRIIRQRTLEKIFYPINDNFFKVSCPENTVHQAIVESDNTATLL